MLAVWLLLVWTGGELRAQEELLVNLAAVDGLDLTPDNLFNFQVQSMRSAKTHALVQGAIRYRNTGMLIRYSFECDIQPGVNHMAGLALRPKYEYSAAALKELFQDFKRLPQGIYEYCVSVKPDYQVNEVTPGVVYDECTYHKSEDIFLINLIDPEDDARIYEYNPVLSWVANYSFAAGLEYRIRVAEIKSGQQAASAIARNNPVYEEKGLRQNSLSYPVYARPLVKDQPYAWTVDAYYKGILLGGAQPWKFTIVEDSLLQAVARNPAYVDIRREQGKYELYAPGILKLKYNLEDLRKDSLRLQLTDRNNKEIKLNDNAVLQAVYGDNRFELDFKQAQPLKHLQPYTLFITSQTGQTFRILFRYVNPELIR